MFTFRSNCVTDSKNRNTRAFLYNSKTGDLMEADFFEHLAKTSCEYAWLTPPYKLLPFPTYPTSILTLDGPSLKQSFPQNLNMFTIHRKSCYILANSIHKYISHRTDLQLHFKWLV